MPFSSHRSRLAVLLAMVLAAACAGPAATTRPTVGPTVPPAPTPTAAPTPTPDPCADPDSIEASLQVHGIEGLLSLELVPGDPGPAATINPFLAEATDQVLGGPAELDLQVDLATGSATDVTLESVTADFVPFEATEAEPVVATIDGATVTLELPSRDVSGLLRVAATWRTPCGQATGGGKLGLKVIDPALAAGCPTTSAGLQAQVEDLQATTLRVGGVGGLHVPIGIVSWSGRWIDAAAIDEVPQFAGWDSAISTTVAPGATMNVKDVLDGVDFTFLRFAFYERADVLAWLEGSLVEISTVDLVRKNPSSTGGVEVPLDFAPGQYVVEIQGTWQTPCLTLESYVAVSVDRA
jgi:hypothetical protein